MAWDEEYRDTLKVTGINVPEWSLPGGGCRIKVEDAVLELTGLRLRTWIVNNWGDELLTSPKFYYKTLDGKSRTRHSQIQRDPGCCPLTGFCSDEDIIDPLRKFVAGGFLKDRATTLEDLLKDCVHSWLEAFEAEYEDQQTLEYFIDMAQVNEWEFDENGNRA